MWQFLKIFRTLSRYFKKMNLNLSAPQKLQKAQEIHKIFPTSHAQTNPNHKFSPP
jgi:hypothetical protein